MTVILRRATSDDVTICSTRCPAANPSEVSKSRRRPADQRLTRTVKPGRRRRRAVRGHRTPRRPRPPRAWPTPTWRFPATPAPPPSPAPASVAAEYAFFASAGVFLAVSSNIVPRSPPGPSTPPSRYPPRERFARENRRRHRAVPGAAVRDDHRVSPRWPAPPAPRESRLPCATRRPVTRRSTRPSALRARVFAGEDESSAGGPGGGVGGDDERNARRPVDDQSIFGPTVVGESVVERARRRDHASPCSGGSPPRTRA